MAYVDRTCRICAKVFKVREDRIKRGRGKYCSRKCFYKVKPVFAIKKPRYTINCKNCKKDFEVLEYRFKENAKYCSVKCNLEFRRKHRTTKECSVDGCMESNHGRGVCRHHYNVMYRRFAPSSKTEYRNRYEKLRRSDQKVKRRLLDNRNRYLKDKYLTDKQHRLSVLLRTRLNATLRRHKQHRGGSPVKLLGAPIDVVLSYLEEQFYDRNDGTKMSWDNWGRAGWHIDHKKPLANFNLENKEDLKIVCHYTNLQPLWMEDNLEKRFTDGVLQRNLS